MQTQKTNNLVNLQYNFYNLIDLFLFFLLPLANAQDDKDKKEETYEQELCKNKDAGEWFRLVAGEGDNCRDVIQCTTSVRNL